MVVPHAWSLGGWSCFLNSLCWGVTLRISTFGDSPWMFLRLVVTDLNDSLSWGTRAPAGDSGVTLRLVPTRVLLIKSWVVSLPDSACCRLTICCWLSIMCSIWTDDQLFHGGKISHWEAQSNFTFLDAEEVWWERNPSEGPVSFIPAHSHWLGLWKVDFPQVLLRVSARTGSRRPACVLWREVWAVPWGSEEMHSWSTSLSACVKVRALCEQKFQKSSWEPELLD